MGRGTPRLAAGAALLIAIAAACSSPSGGTVDSLYVPLPTLKPKTSPTPSASPTATPNESASPGGSGSSGAGSQSSGSQAESGNAGTSDGVDRTSDGKVRCPTGSVTANATSVDSSKTGEDEDTGMDEWLVVVRGTATNNTTHSITSASIFIQVAVPNGDDDSNTAHTGALVPGETGSWTEDFDVTTDTRPRLDHVHVSVSGWSWGNSTLDTTCPH